MSGGGPDSCGGGGGTGPGETKVAGKEVKKGKVQNQCVVCKLTTNKSASNKKGSVQCTICDSWWHMKCAGISPDMLAMITMCRYGESEGKSVKIFPP